MPHATQLRCLRRIQIELQEAHHLSIAVLLNHIDPLVLCYEVVYLAAKWKRSNAQIVSTNLVLLLQLVAALAHSEIAAPVGNNTQLLAAIRDNFRTRRVRPPRFKLAVQALRVVLIVVGTLAVLRLLVVSRAAREISCRRVLCTRQRTIRNSVLIDVLVPCESAETIQILSTQHLAALQRLLRIWEWLRHPVVHSQIEIRKNKDRGLQLLRQIERLNRHREAFRHTPGKEHKVLRITVAKERSRKHIALRRARRQSRRWTNTLNV